MQKVKRFSVIITMRSVLSPDEHWQPYFVKCLPLLVGHAIKPNRQGIQLDSPAKASYNHICWSNNFLEPLPTSCPFTYSFYTNLVSIHLQVPFALIPRSDGGIYTRFAEWKVCHSAHKKCFKKIIIKRFSVNESDSRRTRPPGVLGQILILWKDGFEVWWSPEKY